MFIVRLPFQQEGCYKDIKVLFYSILFYSILFYSTLLYSTLLYSTLLYSTLLYSTLLCSIPGVLNLPGLTAHLK